MAESDVKRVKRRLRELGRRSPASTDRANPPRLVDGGAVDRTASGRFRKVLPVIDESTRKCLWSQVQRQLTGDGGAGC